MDEREYTEDPEQPEGEAEEIAGLEGAEIAALFAADVDPVEIRFRVRGCDRDSVVTLLQMNADKMARFREAVQRGSNVEAEMICLENTVTKLDIYFFNPKTDKVQMQPLPPAGRARASFYERMTPELRTRLYLEALKVNGFGGN